MTQPRPRLLVTSTYYVLEAGRLTSSGEGGVAAMADVRRAMAV